MSTNVQPADLGRPGLGHLRAAHSPSPPLRRRSYLAGVACAVVAAMASPAAAQVLIDDFSTGQATLTAPPGGASSVATAGADILGQRRDLAVFLLAGPGPASAGVAGGALDLSVADSTPDARGEALVTWDGDSDPDTLSPTGLGSVDLTVGGTQGGFRLVIEQAAAGSTLLLTVYQDATRVSRAARVLGTIATSTEIAIAFSELQAAPGAIAAADLGDVGAITLRLAAPETPATPSLRLREIATAAPAVSALKVDLTAAGAPISGAVTPGTTLRYRITIANPGAGAAGVDLEDMVGNDPNLSLVAGSLRTSPLARADGYRTMTDTAIDSDADGLPSLLANDLDADGDALAAMPVNGQATAQGGSVDIAADGHFIYTPPAAFSGVDAFSYSLEATAGDPTSDAGGSPLGNAQATASVIIERVPPVVVAGGSLAYVENDPPTAIDPGITVSDDDSANLVAATATISANYVNGQDLLSFTDTASITGVFVPATGVLTLTGIDTVAAYQAALRAVRYENTSDDPSTAARTVTWIVDDGAEDSLPATSTITVASVNDPPVVTTSAGASAFTEDLGPVIVDAGLTVTDADDSNLISATVVITNPQDGAAEVLAASACAGLTVVPGPNSLTITGSQPLATYQGCLRSVSYDNSSQNPGVTARSISFEVNDGTADSNTATKAVTVTAVNDPPVAGNDSWQTVGNTQLVVDLAALSTPHVRDTTVSGFGVLDNDADAAEGDALSVAGIVGCADVTPPFGDAPACATANGGRILMEANGRFVMTPAAGDSAASDSFQYVLTDDGAPAPATDTATVTIQRFERVWYVRNDAAAGGLGRSHDPFDTLAEAQTASLANDWIFVYLGDGTATGQDAGIVLKAGQRLVGEHVGLTIPVNLNGNGSPQLHAGTPGSRPHIEHSGGGNNAVSATDVFPAEIRGLSLESTAANAIDLTTNAAFASSGSVEIADNVVRGSGTEGIDVNHGGSGTLSLALHDNIVTAGTKGIDLTRTAGVLRITAFDGNVVGGNTGGSGIEVTAAVFDAVAGGAIDQVAGGVTRIGVSGNGVATSGMILSNVTGDLGFTDLDVFNDAGSGLRVTSTGALNAGAGTGFRIAVAAGVATLNATGGPAVDASNASISLPLLSLRSINSSTTGLSLVNAFGGVGSTALSAASGQISDPLGASGAAVSISGGNGNVSLAIPITNNAGNAVAISGRSGDTVAFTGAITETGSGISLTGNTGATIRFVGGLAATTGANPAFTATGGGLLEICDESPCNPAATGALVNTLTTTTATALNVAATTITANNLELRSVSAGTAASGPANGIVLNGTGALGGLKVKGTGSAGSGGTIQRTTASGVSLTSTAAVSLSSMNVQTSGDDGIFGSLVTGISLSGVAVTNNGDSTSDEGIELLNPAGAMTLTNVTATGNAHNNAFIDDTDNVGGNSSLTVTGGTFSNHAVANGNANHGMLIQIRGTATLATSTISGTTFENNRSIGLQVSTGDTATISDLTVSGNTFRDTGTGNSQEIAADFAKAQTSNLTVKVQNNLGLTGHNSHALNFFTAAGAGTTGTFNARISGNTIGNSGIASSGSAIGNCIRININGDADASVLVDSNVLRQCPNGRGIEAIGRNGTGGLDITVTGNDVNPQDTSGFPLAAIFVQSNTATIANTVRSDIRGNTVPAGGTFEVLPTYIALVETSTSTSELVDTPAASATCTDQLTSTNTGSASASAGCALIAGPLSVPP